MSRTTAIVVAAGSGTRLRAGTGGRNGTPKGLALLAGEPLVVHVVRALCAASMIDDVIVVAGVSDLDQASAVLRRAGLTTTTMCAGGATRGDSVRAGLAACPLATRIVAVHDAARPLISPELVDATVAALAQPWSAVAPGLPVVDTLKLLEDATQRVVRTVDRRGLWAVQTPQVFPRDVLERAHQGLRGTAQPTDDLVLVEQAGGRVQVIPGDRRNFKITYPEDLAMAEALLAVSSPEGTA